VAGRCDVLPQSGALEPLPMFAMAMAAFVTEHRAEFARPGDIGRCRHEQCATAFIKGVTLGIKKAWQPLWSSRPPADQTVKGYFQ